MGASTSSDTMLFIVIMLTLFIVLALKIRALLDDVL